MISCVTMTDFEPDLDKRFEDIDVDTILARVGNNKALSLSRKRCLLRAPEFIQRLPAEETVEEGSSVTFSCKLVGLPKPTVTWFKDDDVIGPDARAKTDCDNTGFHSLKIGEVSRCDVGTYKVKASNSEGSSANSLYLSVKARSKNRNRKKKKSRVVACAPMFPAIVEQHAEEQKATLEVERQPESPLTPLYTNISRRSPVTWPEFLGDWGYKMEVDKQDTMDLEFGCEDVFDSDNDSPTTAFPTLTFVSSAYAQLNDVNNVESGKLRENGSINSNKHALDDRDYHDESDGVDNDFSSSEQVKHCDIIKHENRDISASLNDILNNNEKNRNLNENHTFKSGNDVTRKSREDMVRRSRSARISNKDLEERTIYYEQPTISKIAVNRSYATGDSTFSVARRSPSPYPYTRTPVSYSQNEAPSGISPRSTIKDTSTLQNLNNERILKKMKRSDILLISWNYFSKFLYRICDEVHVSELFLMLCGCTCLALYIDLPPSTFILDILIALFIRMVLKFVLDVT